MSNKYEEYLKLEKLVIGPSDNECDMEAVLYQMGQLSSELTDEERNRLNGRVLPELYFQDM
jgi:hypothetical protein